MKRFIKGFVAWIPVGFFYWLFRAGRKKGDSDFRLQIELATMLGGFQIGLIGVLQAV